MTRDCVTIKSGDRALQVDADWPGASGKIAGARGARAVKRGDVAPGSAHEAVKGRVCVSIVSGDGTKQVDGDGGRTKGGTRLHTWSLGQQTRRKLLHRHGEDRFESC